MLNAWNGNSKLLTTVRFLIFLLRRL